MSNSCLVCFYDEIGSNVVSYQIYASPGDFYRSIVKAAFDKSLPFCQFPHDYSVRLVSFLSGFSALPVNEPFNYTFFQIQEAGKGMDPNINFNTSVFCGRLLSSSDEVIEDVQG